MTNLTERQQHDIRNAIVAYGGLRKRMVKSMLDQMTAIKCMDIEIRRIERVALNGTLPPIKPWYKRLFK